MAGERLIKRYFNLMPACEPDQTNYKTTSLQLREQQRTLDKVYNLQYDTHYLTEACLGVSTQQINRLAQVPGPVALDHIGPGLPELFRQVIAAKHERTAAIAADKLTLP